MSGYIGVQPVPQATQTRDTFTATAGQTSFATSGYTPGFLDVFLNGVHLVNGTDYTATNGSDVVLTSGATAGDNLEVVAYTTFQVVDQAFSGNFSVDTDTLFVDAANNRVGIGTSPATKLDVQGTQGGSGRSLVEIRNNHTTTGGNPSWGVGITRQNTSTPALLLGNTNNSDAVIAANGPTALLFGREFSGVWAERMRIDASGNLLVGTTSLLANGSYFASSPGNAWSVMAHANGVASGVEYVKFYYNNGQIGSIAQSGTTGVSYNTTSDRRLKDNIKPITDGTAKLLAMNPVTHTWISDPDAPPVHGFIAQEMADVVPEAVSGDPDGETMMSMDYGRITPVLVAALQDALREIDLLKVRIAQLEGN